MLVAKNWPIGVVVDQDQFRTPSDRHRKPRGENHRDAQSQALWPGLAATECGQRPAHLADPPSHLSGRVCRDKAGHRRGWAFFPNSLAGKTHANANYVHHASLCDNRTSDSSFSERSVYRVLAAERYGTLAGGRDVRVGAKAHKGGQSSRPLEIDRP